MLEDLQNWVGRTQTQSDRCDRARIDRLAALIDDEPVWRAGVLPYLAHWIHFLPIARQAALGPDGHAKRGGFIPPVALPRRMWAGSDVIFHEDIRLNQTITKRSEILSVEPKTSRTSHRGEELIFVKIRHEMTGAQNGRIEEDQHIVYRAAPSSKAANESAPPRHKKDQEIEFSRAVNFDPVLLFRFSALMFNAHRIHYDRDYARQEGYPGLVVHGPLVAMWLLIHFLRHHPNINIRRFSFRARRPLFDISSPALLCSAPDNELWAQDKGGNVVMTASVEMAP